MARMIDAYQAIDIIDEWLDSVGTVMVGKGLSSYGELIGCIEEAPTLTQPNEPLTCQGCACEEYSRDAYPCNSCSRNDETLSDQYRPPEGEEEP